MNFALTNVGTLFLTAGGSSGNLLYTGIIWVGFFALLYFLIIRPQRKKQKEVQNMLQELSVGNKVVTIGGMIGIIKKIEEDTVHITFGGSEKPVIFKKWAIKDVVVD